MRCPMFYEVRILDRKNKVKKTLTSPQLSRKYWAEFEQGFNGSTVKKGKGKKTAPIKN